MCFSCFYNVVSFTVETQNINKEENKRLIIESTEKDFFFQIGKRSRDGGRWRKERVNGLKNN